MYWKLLRDAVERRFSRSAAHRPSRKGTVTELAIGLLVVCALIAQFEHHRGHYTKIRERLATAPAPDTTVRPGGLEPIVLSRSPIPGNLNPEFLSVTLLPGRGMDVLAIRANLPDRGEVDLLAGSSLADAAKAMTGTGDDAAGEANLSHGAPILSPWAGRLGGVVAPDGKQVAVTWRGRSFPVPLASDAKGEAGYGGLLGKTAAVSAESAPMPDGSSMTAVLPPTEGWPSKLETKVFVLMSSRVVELTVNVKNVGTEESPVGIGWSPRFAILSGDRTKATLHLPAEGRLVTGRDGLPTGEIEAVRGTSYSFWAEKGLALGRMSLHDTFVQVRAKFDQSPTVELRDPGAHLRLRMMALSPTIKAIHVDAPAGENFVGIAPQMNYDDPFGREWAKQDSGMKTLAPGESVEWKVRLELLSTVDGTSPTL